MKKYDQKINVALTAEDKTSLEQMAENDRRTPQQMASIFVEDAIAQKRKESVAPTAV